MQAFRALLCSSSPCAIGQCASAGLVDVLLPGEGKLWNSGWEYTSLTKFELDHCTPRPPPRPDRLASWFPCYYEYERASSWQSRAVARVTAAASSMRPSRALLGLAAGVLAPALLYIVLRRRRRLLGPQILARYPCEVSGRPWYSHVVVTELSTDGQATIRGLHFGSASNPPESVVRLVPTNSGLQPVPSALDKAYAPFALLPFALTGGGFAPNSRACLVGVAGGSLLHAWLGCVPGGASLQVDAVELDGAVLRAAREHLGLGCCEATGRVAIHQADGAAFIAAADDEVYDMLMLDLDGVSESAYSMADEVAARAAYRAAYRVLSERGVLVVNEYSESAAHERLEGMLRSVRVLRQYFAEVRVLRTTAQNLMFIATVQRVALPGDGEPFGKLCAAADRLAFVGGLKLDLGTRLRELGPKRCFSSLS